MVIDRIHSKKYPNSLVFKDLSWRFYEEMLREFDEQPSRINYSRGTLEIMTLSLEHERYKTMLGEMLAVLALTFRIRMTRGGSSTLKRISKHKGLEADQCYWIANEPLLRTKKRIDLRVDPPPDLVIEIDVMHSVVNREKIYAALGVPEMWVLSRDARVTAFSRDNGAWRAIERSLSFPFLRVADLDPFVARIGVDDDTSVLADFAEWLKQLKEEQA
jgi:Uma2 family endonuclease